MTGEHNYRPLRSVLYMPASNEKALSKVSTLKADAFILDLEDAVAPSEKDNARTLLQGYLTQGKLGNAFSVVRTNGFNTPWISQDLDMVAETRPSAVLLPKVETAQQVQWTCEQLDKRGDTQTPLWLMIETPLGVLNSLAIGQSHKRVQTFVVGTNDLTKELYATFTADRHPLITSLQMTLLSARACKLNIIDGVFNSITDTAGFEAECRQGLEMGFDGKTIIHPSQLDPCMAVFTPSPEQIQRAKAVITVFEQALSEGKGVAVFEGKIVEELHVQQAKRILAQTSVL